MAADGFPMYYKFGYKSAMDSNSAIVQLKSSYVLKTGERTGDGIRHQMVHILENMFAITNLKMNMVI